MRLGKDLINKPIYSIDEGKLLGKVQDIYLDSTLEVVQGLYTGSQGLVRRKAEFIRSGDVVVFGADAVLVRGNDVVTDDSATPAAKEWIRREKLVGREADTPGGTRLAVIGDVIVDPSGRITGFALSRTYVEGPLAEKRVISRSVVIDTGQEDGRMTVDLSKLEESLLNAEAVPLAVESIGDIPASKVDPSTLFVDPSATE
ncbi:MAG TPA: PRC-barrel domain-containing protein [Promineifilum sp.]|nr:PRC-barrel domain-containing protein [Promineifilum sp.]HRO91628.1 PRC-barrel domain-containing protein [Promineifilum sp.]HRQ13424.1 PRC-barrel domain-containing protein [Promineifilum sp.]